MFVHLNPIILYNISEYIIYIFFVVCYIYANQDSFNQDDEKNYGRVEEIL